MSIVIKNNASNFLADGINDSQTTIDLQSAASFPSLGAGEYFYGTIEDVSGQVEIVKVTNVAGNTLTVVRAQEGTSAAPFVEGSRFELRITVGSVEDYVEQNAELADYTPSGNDVVVRSIQSKLQDIVSVKDFGAVGDGLTDDTDAIQSALDNNSAVFIPEGVFLCDELTLNTNNLVVGGGTLKYNNDTPSSSPQIYLFNATSVSNVKISGVTFDCLNPSNQINALAEADYRGAYIVGNNVENLIVENCTAIKCFDKFVSVGGSTSKDIKILNNNILQAGASEMIGIYGAEGSTVDDFSLNINNVIISNNYIYGNAFSSTPSLTSGQGCNASINATSGSTGHIRFEHVSYGLIESNNLEFASGTGIRVEQSTNVNVSNNTLNLCNSGIEIYLAGYDVVVTNNIIKGFGWLPSAASLVTYDGVVYNCIFRNSNQQPDISPAYWEVWTKPYSGSPPAWDNSTIYNKYLGDVGIGVYGSSNSFTFENIIVQNNIVTGDSTAYPTQNYCLMAGISPVNKFGTANNTLIAHNTVAVSNKENLYITYQSSASDPAGFSNKLSQFNNKYSTAIINTLPVDDGPLLVGTKSTASSNPVLFPNFVVGQLKFNNTAAGNSNAYLRGISGGTSSFTSRISLAVYTSDGATDTNSLPTIIFGANKTVIPGEDDTQSLGVSNFRWSDIYAGNGTIQTSDERQKQNIENLSEIEKRVALKLKALIKKFKFTNAVKKKGDAARTHVGIIAQDVVDAFASENLDAYEYGMLCYDKIEAQPETIGELGEVLAPAQPETDQYGVRYDQILAFIIASI